MKKEKGKKKRRKACWIIALVVVVALAAGGGIGMMNVLKEHEEITGLALNAVDFSRLEDGVYIGEYEGGMYQWRQNKVQVTVTEGKVSDIKLLSSAEAENLSDPDPLYERVIQNQTLQVDVISGATLTSKGYLQAVENALLQAEKKG